MSSTIRLRARIAAVITVGLCAGVGVGVVMASGSGLSQDNESPEDKSAMVPTGQPVVYGSLGPTPGTMNSSSPAPVQTLSAVLDRLSSKTVETAEFIPAPEWANDTSVPWLRVTVEGGTGANGAATRPVWEASLIQGAVADELRTDQVSTGQVIGGADVESDLGDGKTSNLDLGGESYVAAGQTFTAQTSGLTDDQISQQIKDQLTKYDLTPTSVEVLHPLGPAVAIIATVNDQAPISWTIDDLLNSLGGEPKAYEGIYLEIDSPDDSPLIKSAASYRTGLGQLWFAAGQDKRFGANHGSAVGPAAHGGSAR